MNKKTLKLSKTSIKKLITTFGQLYMNCQPSEGKTLIYNDSVLMKIPYLSCEVGTYLLSLNGAAVEVTKQEVPPPQKPQAKPELLFKISSQRLQHLYRVAAVPTIKNESEYKEYQNQHLVGQDGYLIGTDRYAFLCHKTNTKTSYRFPRTLEVLLGIFFKTGMVAGFRQGEHYGLTTKDITILSFDTIPKYKKIPKIEQFVPTFRAGQYLPIKAPVVKWLGLKSTQKLCGISKGSLVDTKGASTKIRIYDAATDYRFTHPDFFGFAIGWYKHIVCKDEKVEEKVNEMEMYINTKILSKLLDGNPAVLRWRLPHKGNNPYIVEFE